MDANALAIANAWSGVGKNLLQGQANFERGKMDAATRLAQQFAAESAGRLNQEKAIDLQQRRKYQTPEFGSKIAAAMVGLPDGAGSEIEQFQQQGNWGMNPEQPLPMDQSGPPRPESPKAAPNWYQPGVEQRYNMARGAHLANLGGTGDTNAEQMIKGFAALAERGDLERAMAGGNQGLNAYQAAMKGKMYDATTRGVLDQSTGQEAVNQDWRNVQRSAAAENYAQAGNASASAALSRSKIGQPTVNPDGSVTAPTGRPIKLSSTAEKELFEADDVIGASKTTIDLLNQALELNQKSYSGYFAKPRATLASNVLPAGKAVDADNTILLDNIMTTQALESLKMIFGGMPTEGERKILLEIQASADKTPPQREAIIKKATDAAQKRLISATNKANSLRSGTYNTINPQVDSTGGWSIKEVK